MWVPLVVGLVWVLALTGGLYKLYPVRDPPWENKECGQRYPYVIKEKTGAGIEFGEAPWSVTIVSKNPHVYDVCFGALIHPQAVITSFNCLRRITSLHEGEKSGQSLMIRTGHFHGQTPSSRYPLQEVNGSQLFLAYTDNNYNAMADLALLILSSAVDFNKTVNTICLPNDKVLFGSSNCWLISISDNTLSRVYTNPFISERIYFSGLYTCPLSDDRFKICSRCQIGEPSSKIHEGTPMVCPMKNNPDRYVLVGTSSNHNGVQQTFSNMNGTIGWIESCIESGIDSLKKQQKPPTSSQDVHKMAAFV